jgi:hypothetical protein
MITLNLKSELKKICVNLAVILPSREKVTQVASNKSGTISDMEVLEFYNLATGKLLRGLEV